MTTVRAYVGLFVLLCIAAFLLTNLQCTANVEVVPPAAASRP